MPFPFDIWSPVFRGPFSGDVLQTIEPRLLSPTIKGNPEIETRIQTEVASFGKQLGKILEALQTLSAATATPLPEIDTLVAGVEAVKARTTTELRQDAERALARLRAADEAAWRALTGT